MPSLIGSRPTTRTAPASLAPQGLTQEFQEVVQGREII
jgi:hypothetical protein